MYNEVSREDGKRRAVIHLNIRGRDLGTFVAEAMTKVQRELKLPSGYWVSWGGEFEHLQTAKKRLTIVIPMSFGLICASQSTSWKTSPASPWLPSGHPASRLLGGRSGPCRCWWKRDSRPTLACFQSGTTDTAFQVLELMFTRWKRRPGLYWSSRHRSPAGAAWQSRLAAAAIFGCIPIR